MKELKGTKTEQNLCEAFAGEAMARNRYTYYAKKARKEGYEQIADIFEETARHELSHAKTLFKFLYGGVGSTADNLRTAAEGEHFEATDMYLRMAQEAREDGFAEIAAKFEIFAAIERHHEERFRKLLENIENGVVFSRDGDRVWICRKCGHVVVAKTAPKVCAGCDHPQSYFELEASNF